MKFQVGKKYQCRSVCDNDCKWQFEVVKRTAKSIWIKDADGEVQRKAVSFYCDIEKVWPLGRYSMAPILSADKQTLKC